jgi:hypothetical protein
VLEQDLAHRIESKVREDITESILREAKLDERVATAIATIKTPDGLGLVGDIEQLFEEQSDREWRDAIEAVASRVAREYES